MGYAACADFAAALADFDRALELAREAGAEVAELLYQRGLCLLGLGERERAEADLLESRRFGGRREEIDVVLARVG